ncbi:MAG: glycosyltransferase family 2 protein [Herpetosiphonaceae bacterium]|nr:glycosyltransferase family 2 protein [Herpetosiphonaceae bacterium]
MTNVAVIILAWNGHAFLPDCLTAVLAQDCPARFDVLVVDNASSDGSIDLVRTQFPQVAVMENHHNLGFAGGNNVGLRALLAGVAPSPCDVVPDIVVLLNQDTIVAPNWLAELVAVFERRPQAGIVGCKIFFPGTQTLQHAGGTIQWPVGTGLHRGTGEQDHGQYDTEVVLDYVTGAALALRSPVLQQIGLLDEGFSPAYYEDTDLCYRARAAGFEVVYAPRAQLQHHEGTSLQAQSPAHQRAYHRNRLRFVLKHAPLPVLTEAFAPAEEEEMRRWGLTNSQPRKQAYLDAILALPELLQQRLDAGGDVPYQLLALLETLYRQVVTEEQLRRAEALNPAPQTS